MRILHLFNWKLNDILFELEKIKEQGFDSIQINPIQPLKENNYENWWLSYQPCSFDIGNQYGSKEDLINLCKISNKFDIKIIADVICNHVAGSNDGRILPNEKVDPKIRNNPYFFKDSSRISNWENRYEVINCSLGLPSLKTDNYEVQDLVINFLNELIDCGVEGFRFDAAKNIALPTEGCDFWPRVTYSLKKYGIFNYGEIIFANEELIDEYCKYINVITNSNCKCKNQKVAYVENHDSYLEFGYSRSKTTEQINYEYSFVSDEYENTLYYSRPFDDSWKKEIVSNSNKVYKKRYH